MNGPAAGTNTRSPRPPPSLREWMVRAHNTRRRKLLLPTACDKDSSPPEAELRPGEAKEQSLPRRSPERNGASSHSQNRTLTSCNPALWTCLGEFNPTQSLYDQSRVTTTPARTLHLSGRFRCFPCVSQLPHSDPPIFRGLSRFGRDEGVPRQPPVVCASMT